MPSRPVVFVPGFPASELWRHSPRQRVYPPSLSTLTDPIRKRAFIDAVCNEDLVAGEPIREIIKWIAPEAQTLYDILRDYGYSVTEPSPNFAAVGWDWRKGVDDVLVLDAFESAIDNLFNSSGQKCVVIVHSTGGLVLRRLLEMRPHVVNRIEHILALGVPWGGTLKAFRFASVGEKFGILSASLSKTEAAKVMRHAQAAFDLFPPAPVAGASAANLPPTLVVNANGDQISPLLSRQWVPAGDKALIDAHCDDAARLTRPRKITLPSSHQVPPITNLVGWGAKTDTKCTIGSSGSISFGQTDQGDSTVPLVSAEWLEADEVRTFYLPIGIYTTGQIPEYHSHIWSGPPLLEIFDQVLNGKAAEPFLAVAVEPDDIPPAVGGTVRLRISAADARGRALPAAAIAFSRLQQPIARALNGVRDEVVIPRSALPIFISGAYYRFEAIIGWRENSVIQQREIPIMFRR